MPFLFFPHRNLAVTKLNAPQCQDKTAPKKTLQRRRQQRSWSKKKNKENLPHHLKAKGAEKGDDEDYIWSAASGNAGKRKRGKISIFETSRSKKGLNLDASWCRKQLSIPSEEDAGHFRNVQGKSINQISERSVNALYSYQEANYHYQPPLFVRGIIRLITKLSPLETRFALFIRTKLLLSSNDTVSVMKPISICTS